MQKQCIGLFFLLLGFFNVASVEAMLRRCARATVVAKAFMPTQSAHRSLVPSAEVAAEWGRLSDEEQTDNCRAKNPRNASATMAMCFSTGVILASLYDYNSEERFNQQRDLYLRAALYRGDVLNSADLMFLKNRTRTRFDEDIAYYFFYAQSHPDFEMIDLFYRHLLESRAIEDKYLSSIQNGNGTGR